MLLAGKEAAAKLAGAGVLYGKAKSLFSLTAAQGKTIPLGFNVLIMGFFFSFLPHLYHCCAGRRLEIPVHPYLTLGTESCHACKRTNLASLWAGRDKTPSSTVLSPDPPLVLAQGCWARCHGHPSPHWGISLYMTSSWRGKL